MVNPKKLMELNRIKDDFVKRHPKVMEFFQKIAKEGIQEGSVIELTITRPDGSKTGSNMRVQKEDLELVEMLKELGSKKD